MEEERKGKRRPLRLETCEEEKNIQRRLLQLVVRLSH